MSFDAFGQRRSSLDWNIGFPPGTELDPIRDVTTRGYTGHHMVDAVKLIHMGGRIYDPALGRFLSPDPNIPEPGNTQAYNRYAYVYNNPLSFTDPSGFIARRNEPAKALSNWFGGMTDSGTALNSGLGRMGDNSHLRGPINTSEVTFSLEEWEEASPEGRKRMVNVAVNNATANIDPSTLMAINLPLLPQGVVDFAAGFGDALLLGTGGYIRGWMGLEKSRRIEIFN